jgi:hypothetical protein
MANATNSARKAAASPIAMGEMAAGRRITYVSAALFENYFGECGDIDRPGVSLGNLAESRWANLSLEPCRYTHFRL